MSDQYLSDGERLRCIGCGKVPPVVVPSKFATGFGICHPCAVAAANKFQAKKDEVDAFMASGRWRSPPGLTDDPPTEPPSATAAPAGQRCSFYADGEHRVHPSAFTATDRCECGVVPAEECDCDEGHGPTCDECNGSGETGRVKYGLVKVCDFCHGTGRSPASGGEGT